MTQLSILPALCLFLACTVLVGCRSGSNSSAGGRAASDTTIPAVEAVEARSGGLPLRQRLTGRLRAAGEIAIFPQTSGPVAEVYVQNGDAVKTGEPLVRIQATGTRPQLAQARSNLQVSQAELQQAQARLRELEMQLERMLVLGDKGLLPADTVDTQRAQVDASRADVARARAQVAVAKAAIAEREELQQQTIVRAPITGRIGQRNVEVGMQVDPQSALFVIGRLENMRVEVAVTQDVLRHVREGHRVELHVPAEHAPIAAAVSRISPFLEEGTYSAEVEIDVPNHAGALVPGMFVAVDIFYGESEEATLVPVSALYEHPGTGTRGVFVASQPPGPLPAADPGDQAGSSAALPSPMPVPFRAVDVRAEGDQTVGITGVEPGEWVIVVGQHLLSTQRDQGPPQARVRPIAWDRILALQGLQRHDLLKQFMDKQQRLAATGGS